MGPVSSAWCGSKHILRNIQLVTTDRFDTINCHIQIRLNDSKRTILPLRTLNYTLWVYTLKSYNTLRSRWYVYQFQLPGAEVEEIAPRLCVRHAIRAAIKLYGSGEEPYVYQFIERILERVENPSKS